MSADPSNEEKPRGLRPLPSVDMALLPHELRARRTRRIVFGTLTGAAVLAALLFWIARSLIPQTWTWMEDKLGRQDAKLAEEDSNTEADVDNDARRTRTVRSLLR